MSKTMAALYANLVVRLGTLTRYTHTMAYGDPVQEEDPEGDWVRYDDIITAILVDSSAEKEGSNQ